MPNIDQTIRNLVFSDNKIDYDKIPLIYVLAHIQNHYKERAVILTRKNNPAIPLIGFLLGFLIVCALLLPTVPVIILLMYADTMDTNRVIMLLMCFLFFWVPCVWVFLSIWKIFLSRIHDAKNKISFNQLINDLTFEDIPRLDESKIIKIFGGITKSTVIVDNDYVSNSHAITSEILELYNKKYETYYLKKIDDDNYCVVYAIHKFLIVEEELYSRRISVDKIITLLSNYDQYKMGVYTFNTFMEKTMVNETFMNDDCV